MPNSIIIQDVRVSELDAEKMTAAMHGTGVRWHILSVTVKNASDSTSLYVISVVRSIRYDAIRRALVLQFGEHEVRPPKHSLTRPLPAGYAVVAPKDEVTLTHRLSSRINFIENSLEGPMRQYGVHLPEDVDTLDCRVAYSVSPPAADANLTARGARDAGQNWGTIVEASYQLTSPGHEPAKRGNAG